MLLHRVMPAHHGMGLKYAHQAVLGDVSVKHLGFGRVWSPQPHALGDATVVIHRHKVLGNFLEPEKSTD